MGYLIYCNCLLGKTTTAVEPIKGRLSERSNDPQLVCSLSDVTKCDVCKENTPKVSYIKSTQALHSLAHSDHNRGD